MGAGAHAGQTGGQTLPGNGQTLLPNNDPTRRGDWIQTFSGACFWPLDPRPEDVNIIDIAHALSMKCRFGGHTKRFYSVAEHSILVSLFCDPPVALWGLLHDAAEAYSADVPSPLKASLAGWDDMEDRIMAAVAARFGLTGPEPEAVRYFDRAILTDERAALMTPCVRAWPPMPERLGASVYGWDPRRAEVWFLERFAELTTAGQTGGQTA
jgi:hypothetical protein